MSVLRSIWLNLVFIAVLVLQADAVFSQVFHGVRQSSGAGRSVHGSNYFTVIGHVARPNSYELPTSSPSLVNFIQYTGNLTAPASGQLRIVRDGRVVQSTFFSEESSLILAPGDIVVVDGKASQGRMIGPGNSGATTGTVGLAITGVRDYAVVLNLPAEKATIRSIVRHLGLHESHINSVKAITARSSNQVFPDTRLKTGTVLAFNPSMVDPSRVSVDLPSPLIAARASSARRSAQTIGTPGDSQPATLSNRQRGDITGRAIVPGVFPKTQSASSSNGNTNLSKEDQELVKELLTDPTSVQLDEPALVPPGRAFVGRPSSSEPEPGSVHLSDQERTSESGSDGLTSGGSTASAAAVSSGEATRPYQSTSAAPEPLQPLGISRAAAISPDTYDSNNAGDDSLAVSAENRVATSDAIDPELSDRVPVPIEVQRVTQPDDTVQGASVLSDRSAFDDSGSRLLPPPPAELNVPVVSVLIVGILGAIAAAFLIYSIAHDKPVARVAQIDTSGRYWLDRMIENDVPVVEENVDFPHNTQLFGKPAPIQRIDAAHKAIPRPHFSALGGKSGVPNSNPAMPDAPSPDTSDSGQRRIVRVHTGRPSHRQLAQAVPEPHSLAPSNKPGVELFEDVGNIETAVFGDATENENPKINTQGSTPKRDRSFRIDTRHISSELSVSETASKPDSGAVSSARPNLLKEGQRNSGSHRRTRQAVSVQPSPIVVQSNDLLDRILSTVDSDQRSAQRHSSGHQTDERGNS